MYLDLPCPVAKLNFAGPGRSEIAIISVASDRVRVKETHLPKNFPALCDQVRTIDKRRIRETLGVLGDELLGRVDRGLILHLELEDYVTV